MTYENNPFDFGKPMSTTLLAANIQSVVDSHWTLTEMPTVMRQAPHAMLAHLWEQVSVMSDDEREMVYRITSAEMLMSEGRDPAKVIGSIHLMAVLAPVFAAIANHPNIEVNKSDLVATFEDIQKNVRMIWRCDSDGFHLDQPNRFFYVRGLALLVLKQSREGNNTNLLDHKLDRHIMWVGSRFDDLVPNLDAVSVGSDFSREFLAEVAEASVPAYLAPEGESESVSDLKAFMQNNDRRTGYDKPGHYSVVPEDKLRGVRENSGYAYALASGVHLSLSDYDFIEHASGKDFEQKEFIQSLAILVRDLYGTEEDHGEVAMTFMHFNNQALEQISELCALYSAEDRRALFNYLVELCERRDPMEPIRVTEFKSRIAAFAVPAVRAYFDAAYEPEPMEEFDYDILDRDDFENVDEYESYLSQQEDQRLNDAHEHEQHLADERTDALNEELHELTMYWLESCDEACADDSMEDYIAKVRILAIVRGAQIDYTVEHEIFMDEIIDRVDALCRNAKLIVRTKDLSPSMLKQLK
jgi:hypothetical protein